MRTGSTLNFLLGDHLGSSSLTTDANAVVSEMRYTPWGEVRYNAGVTPTDYTYTGQYSNTADFGLMFYNARWYDPYLGRMAQADTIIPPGVQGLDRYAYVNNSPMNFVDPTGHCPVSGDNWCYEEASSLGETDGRDENNNGDNSNPSDTNNNGISDQPVDDWTYLHPADTCYFNNLTECYYAGEYWPSGDFEFSDKEWETFMYALYMNISDIAYSGEGFWTGTFDPDGRQGTGQLFVPFHTKTYYLRESYDTPLFNGDTSGIHAYTGTICVNGKCSDRNDVNYVAQGMWSAAGSETPFGARLAADQWKQQQYGRGASPDVLYWAQYGAFKFLEILYHSPNMP